MSSNNIDFVSHYNVFPNPANTTSGVNLYLNSKQSFTELSTCITSRVNFPIKMKHNFHPGDNAVRLKRLQIEQGVYMIQVQTDYGILVQKLLSTTNMN
ncbi:MAG: hypothetical protein R2769_09610 [Saprospiraceae bacterium]